MANQLGGLFQTLVAATSAAADNLTYQNSFVDAIYWDFKPVVATPNTTLNVIIPTVNEGDVADIGNGPLNPTDTDHNNISIPYNRHFSTSFVIKTWDQSRTPQDLERTYMKPRLEALLRAVNRTIAQQFTTTNFGTSASPIPGYAILNGSTSGYFLRSDIVQAWENLVNEGVPTEAVNDMFFLTSPTAYGGMLGDSTMSYQYIVGDPANRQAIQDAKLTTQLGANVRYDQHLGQISTSLGFTTGKQAGILMHRYACAAVTAQPPPTDQQVSGIQEQIVWLKNVLPVQIQAGFSLKDQGTIVNIHCYWGVAPARPDFASFINSN
jgi:hypothetical protein